MAIMNLSLPDPMKEWVERQSRTGRYANASDCVRDLNQRDEDSQTAIAELQQLVDEGLRTHACLPSRQTSTPTGTVIPRHKPVLVRSPGFCIGPLGVNPFCAHPAVGSVLLSAVGAGAAA